MLRVYTILLLMFLIACIPYINLFCQLFGYNHIHSASITLTFIPMVILTRLLFRETDSLVKQGKMRR